MEQDRLVFNTALSSLNSAATAANPKIVASVETVWKAILKHREASYDIGFYADILTKEEWCDLPSNSRQRERVKAIANAGDARQLLLSVEKGPQLVIDSSCGPVSTTACFLHESLPTSQSCRQCKRPCPSDQLGGARPFVFRGRAGGISRLPEAGRRLRSMPPDRRPDQRTGHRSGKARGSPP
jgi:hypothetical protein